PDGAPDLLGPREIARHLDEPVAMAVDGDLEAIAVAVERDGAVLLREAHELAPAGEARAVVDVDVDERVSLDVAEPRGHEDARLVERTEHGLLVVRQLHLEERATAALRLER